MNLREPLGRRWICLQFDGIATAPEFSISRLRPPPPATPATRRRPSASAVQPVEPFVLVTFGVHAFHSMTGVVLVLTAGLLGHRALLDLGALSLRHDKPLTARLMPIPDKRAGDKIHFDFPYFADSGVLALDAQDLNGMLINTDILDIGPYPSSKGAISFNP